MAKSKSLSIEEILLRGASHRAQRLSFDELKSMKVAFWDIEASDLSANFGHLICAGVKTLGEKEVRIYRIDESPHYRDHVWDDSWVAEQVRNDLEQHQIIVHHYGDRYDIPFLNTRLIGARRRMLNSNRMAFVDTWLNIRKRLKLTSNRLATIIDYLDTKVTKTALNGRIWVMAGAGHSPSIDYIVKHNIHDVRALEEVTLELARFYNLRYTYLK